MFTLQRLAQALEATLPQDLPRPRRLCLALSGGLDSTVLLVALAGCRSAGHADFALRAVHVDHGLHADSALWSQTCLELARQSNVPCEIVRVAAHAGPGESPEAAARDARYAALHERLAQGEVLLTAHHADDQLETVLLQWLRGGGLRAVAGMEKFSRAGRSAWHARPLLDFTRDELRAWATTEGLHWLEDPSNVDRRYDRNYLRHEVLPILRQRWPGAARTTGRVAEFARDALELESGLAAADLAPIAMGATIDWHALLQLPDPRQRAALRAWLHGLNLPLPAAETLAALRRDMARAAADRVPEVRWRGAVVHRYRDRLYAEAERLDEVQEGEWEQGTYRWSHDSTLELVADTGIGLSQALVPGRLAVRRRRGGESFKPSGGAHRRELRKWLQEHDVLPWRRGQLPLLFAADGRLVAVADLAFAAEFAARPGEPSWRVAWNRSHPVTAAEFAELKWRGDPPIR